MSVDEHGLGEKAHSERFAHSVTDFARKRQEVRAVPPSHTVNAKVCLLEMAAPPFR